MSSLSPITLECGAVSEGKRINTIAAVMQMGHLRLGKDK
jgi:hypothetical protein